MKRTFKYETADIVIVWEPQLCCHAGICVEMLPRVYDPNDRPWIKPENAATEELIRQIDSCPSGALSYRIKKK